MTEASKTDLSRMRFDRDRMQVVSLSRVDKAFSFPLTRGPINFSVFGSDGSESSRWGVKTNKKGDVYVYCRDLPGSSHPPPKVSLHPSGRHHISITPETREFLDADSRFSNVWKRTKVEDEAIASFSLLFPPFASGEPERPTINKDELLIMGHPEMLVVVGFFIVDSAVEVRYNMAHFALGELPLPPSEVLRVVAWKEPMDEDLPDRIRAYFPMVASAFAQRPLAEGDYTLCLHGYRKPNSAYMMPIPVRYMPQPKKERGTEEQAANALG